jgi:oligopeptide transport system permease protein
MRVYWYLGVFPTLAIAITMLGFTFFGDGLRDAFDASTDR